LHPAGKSDAILAEAAIRCALTIYSRRTQIAWHQQEPQKTKQTAFFHFQPILNKISLGLKTKHSRVWL